MILNKITNNISNKSLFLYIDEGSGRSMATSEFVTMI